MGEGKVDLVTVLGHTAGGKTAFAAHLANRLDGEIISADSRQVYRDMNVGTGKDYEDYLVEGNRIPVHLIDILEAGFEYNVYLFKQDFLRVFTDITDRELVPILCGGSGLYLESVLRNYQLIKVPVNVELRESLDKKSFGELTGILKLYGPLHNVTDSVSRKRIIRAIEIAKYQSSLPEGMSDRELNPARSVTSPGSFNPLVLGIKYERVNRRERITDRLQHRLDHGMVEEVEGLIKQGISVEKMDYYGLEYRYVSRYILKELTFDEMFTKLNTAIHQFAKRQMTYFRGMERRGVNIHWLEGESPLEEKLRNALHLYHQARNISGNTI